MRAGGQVSHETDVRLPGEHPPLVPLVAALAAIDGLRLDLDEGEGDGLGAELGQHLLGRVHRQGTRKVFIRYKEIRTLSQIFVL